MDGSILYGFPKWEETYVLYARHVRTRLQSQNIQQQGSKSQTIFGSKRQNRSYLSFQKILFLHTYILTKLFKDLVGISNHGVNCKILTVCVFVNDAEECSQNQLILLSQSCAILIKCVFKVYKLSLFQSISVSVKMLRFYMLYPESNLT